MIEVGLEIAIVWFDAKAISGIRFGQTVILSTEFLLNHSLIFLNERKIFERTLNAEYTLLASISFRCLAASKLVLHANNLQKNIN